MITKFNSFFLKNLILIIPGIFYIFRIKYILSQNLSLFDKITAISGLTAGICFAIFFIFATLLSLRKLGNSSPQIVEEEIMSKNNMKILSFWGFLSIVFGLIFGILSFINY